MSRAHTRSPHMLHSHHVHPPCGVPCDLLMPAMQVLHMGFDLAGSGMHFAPGDSLGVLPHNDPHLVGLLLKRLGWEASRAFRVHSSDEASTGARLLAHLKWPCTLRDALLYGCDITSVPK